MGKEEKNMNDNLARDLEPKKISYADLLKFDDDKRYELIDGMPYLMASPKVSHQELVGEIYFQLKVYLNGKRCKPFISPLDVKLSGEKDDSKEFHVVQPDVMVVCDPNKITERNILGVPDLVIEILSPSNASHDKVRKLNLYQQFGVKEYWMVSLEEKSITALILNDQKIYTVSQVRYLDEKVKVNILDNCYIDLKEFCENNNIIIEKDKMYKMLMQEETKK